MTDEKAIEILENEMPSCGEKAVYSEGERCEAYDKAISALRAQQEESICGCTNLECASCTPGPCEHRRQPNAPLAGWVSVKERLPEDSDELVLAIVSGKPCKNITLDGAYELAVYCKGEGWIVEQYPEWETPEVAFWMPLPEPPEEGTK